MRAAIISDIHANLIAMEAVLEASQPFDVVWCLGDLVGYGPRPQECIALLRSFPHLCVAGNHDYAAIGRLKLEEFNAVAVRAFRWTLGQLNTDNLGFLESLPNRIIDDPVMLVHGSPRQPIWEYLCDPFAARQNFDLLDTEVCFVGHTHRCTLFIENEVAQGLMREPRAGDTFVIGAGGRAIVNPGSVGQPRDGDPRAAYAIYDAELGVITFHRVEYDIDSTARQMQEAGLPSTLIHRLARGE